MTESSLRSRRDRGSAICRTKITYFSHRFRRADLAALQPSLKLVDLEQEQVLFEAGDNIDATYFPTSAVISIVVTLSTGQVVEAAMVGRDGVIGASAALDLAKGYAGKDFDLVICFDCLHDMGDPAGASAHIRQSLKPDGTRMIVEPMAGDTLEQNLNPVGRLYYAGSTTICLPTSLSQEVGAGLGAQAGEKKLHEVITSGGFKSVRRATETPFNMILEATI